MHDLEEKGDKREKESEGSAAVPSLFAERRNRCTLYCQAQVSYQGFGRMRFQEEKDDQIRMKRPCGRGLGPGMLRAVSLLGVLILGVVCESSHPDSSKISGVDASQGGALHRPAGAEGSKSGTAESEKERSSASLIPHERNEPSRITRFKPGQFAKQVRGICILSRHSSATHSNRTAFSNLSTKPRSPTTVLHVST